MPTDQARIRLLLVEDDPLQVAFLQHNLSKKMPSNIVFSCMTDPVAARELLKRNEVDILVTDLDMPEISGVELVRDAKERNPVLQCLVLTAASTWADLIAALDLGAADYLLKPVDCDLLMELIQQAADRLRRWHSALAGTLIQGRKNRQAAAEKSN